MNRSALMRESWGSWMSQSVRPAGPAWWQFAWTFVFAMVVAAGFTVIGFVMFARGEGAWRNLAGWGQWYLNYLVVSLTIGYSIQGLFIVGKRVLGASRIQRFAPWQRMTYFPAVSITGLGVGLAIGLPLVDSGSSTWRLPVEPNAMFGSVLLSLMVWLLFQVYFSTRHRRVVAERRAAQAQLQLLQAQMEPHFLFNTLANVLSLMDADAPRAKAMLESFTDYLRASLGSLRRAEHTLGAELDLVEAYLKVASVRMEDRLRYVIDVPAALRSTMVPALSLQPLVENAVLHGLEPSIDGGRIAVSAERDAERLVIRVADDGRGLDATRAPGHRGTGTALGNIRERLRQTYGDGASLRIEAALPLGVCATLTLPLSSIDAI